MIGAAATVADYNGVPNASHIRDKLVEMTHLNETIYSSGIAASHELRDKIWQLSVQRYARQCVQAQRHTVPV